MANEEHLKILRQGVEEWNGWRKQHRDTRPDLGKANLRVADLRGANLHRANLYGAVLEKADLSLADLSKADLKMANLRECQLFRTNLSNAILVDADLTAADLYEVMVEGADFHKVRLHETVLANMDLTRVRRLDSCNHVGPSVIDQRTLQKSANLSFIFLRGCGLSDIFIEKIPELCGGNAIQFYSCFISYSSADQEFATRLHSDLQAHGIRCWFAPDDLKIGVPVRSAIEEAIRLRDKLVLIFSEASINSDWVEHEVTKALEEEHRRDTTVLFPIRIDSAVMDTGFGWTKRIREAHKPTGLFIGDFCAWKDHDKYKTALERLLRDLKK